MTDTVLGKGRIKWAQCSAWCRMLYRVKNGKIFKFFEFFENVIFSIFNLFFIENMLL